MKGREQKLTLRQMGAILCRAFSVSLRTKSAVTIAINLLGFGLAFCRFWRRANCRCLPMRCRDI